MDLKRCINMACGVSSASMEWHRGWVLRSNDFAVLCDECGQHYDKSNFCNEFHSNDSGWRQCDFCGKLVHCGCIASRYLYELLDTGGIICIICAIRSRHQSAIAPTSSVLRKHDGSGTSRIKNVDELQSTTLANQFNSTKDSYVGTKQDEILAYSQQLRRSLMSLFYPGSSSSGSSLAQTNLSMTLDEREQGKTSLPNNASMAPTRTNEPMAALPRIQGRNQQLLAHNWPRITDQELQQISGEYSSNSTVVPLFEKVLSASDAAPVGRIVLPKACAEPEGVPLEMHDVQGNVWNVQYRFWLNNNSRMYVLEGVSDCLQSMQLKARDPVTFSRMDPQWELIIGVCQKTTSPPPPPLPTLPPPPPPPPPSPSPSAAQSLNGSSHPNPQDATTSEGRKREGSGLPQAPVPTNKRTLTTASDEAQDLFHPPVAVNPPHVMLEDQAFEEYEDPPIHGRRSIFTVRSNRINEQWTQCGSCSKWRKIPVDILLPAKWTFVDNIWDQSRCTCAAPNELTPRELDNLVNIRNNEGFEELRMEASHEPTVEHESSGLHTLADAAPLEANAGESSSALATITSKGKRKASCTCTEAAR